ncbi:MAG: T9SS type A sorting domain-containing protein [Bacteroidota bacterium]
MKATIVSKSFLRPIVVLGITTLLFSIKLFAQPTFVAEAGSPSDNGSSTTSTIAITPPASLQAQDLVIIYAHYRGNVTLNINNAGGQVWNTATALAGNSNQSFAIFWCIFNGTWAAPPVVGGGSNGTPLSAVMYAFRPSIAGNSWTVNAGPNNAGPTNNTAISITGLTTTLPNTVTMAFWGSSSATTWSAAPTGTGWLKTGLSQQFRNTGGSDQSHTAAYNIRATSGAVANVSQTQSSSQNTRTSIISFAEVVPPVNDICSNPVSLTPSPSCSTIPGTLTGANYSTSSGTCNTLKADVWYSFTAQTTNPTITVGGLTNARFQVLSGTCGGTLTTNFCSTASSQAVTGLTIGNTYLVRVFSTTLNSGTFTVCVDDPSPANDASSSATTITPGITCSNTAGNLYAATASGTPTITGTCVAGTVSSDIWYTFVAPADIVSISLSGAGSDVTGVELLTGTTGNMYSIACGGTTGIPTASIVTGTTYYIRVYTNGAAPASSVNAGFNICVTVPSIPNDECSGAINLPVNAGCSKVFGTISMSTLSAGFGTAGTCGSAGSAAYDVWYKFTATNATPTITLGDFGTVFSGTRRMELYQGVCGSLSPMNQCVNTTGTSLALSATGLTVGDTYYIRIYNTAAASIGNGKFSICITDGSASSVRIGNSYVNVSKNTAGGVVEPGDILEIRMTVWVGAGTLYKTRYLDSIPTHTGMLTTDPIRIITNEGLTYKSYSSTDGLNDDAATYKSSAPGEYNIRLNLGLSTTPANLPGAPADNSATDETGAGNLPSSANPRGGSGLMFATSFRIQVTGNVGDTIALNGGQFIYRETSATGTLRTLTGTPYKILITEPLSLCANSVGVNNALEYGGTFGSGNTLSRSSDLSNPIAGYTFVTAGSAQAINDGQYAVVNNTSPRGSTNESAFFAPSTATTPPDMVKENRMFNGFWYIDGDHSGTNNTAGNNPVAPGSTGGYMLAVNADYVASEAYRQTLTGLCPNTYYEFSAWIKNICPLCGIDSLGKQFTNSAIIANQSGYPGVLPNLTFSMDGLDRYSTGQIDIGGENAGWVKKGFVFKTDSTQVSATLSIRNNSQGGGGNDWAMDDISIATCFPSMSYSPTATPSVCSGNTIQIGDTVRSQFSNYAYYVWQRSHDGGATWSDITTTQTALPVLTGSQYQYITTLNVPSANTTLTDSGDIYRVYTATTVSNITSPNCIANDGSAPISLSVLDCGIVLKTDLVSFNGNLMNKYAVLSWSTSKEELPVHFELQRSDDNTLFNTIAIINGKNSGQQANYYSFTDPQLLNSKKWYRLILLFDNGAKKYSHTIQLNTTSIDFEIDNVVNPFKEQVFFNVITSKSSKVNVELIDMQGKVVKSNSFLVYPGTNSLRLLNTDILATGIYSLRVQNNDKSISKKVIKSNN